MSEQQQPGTQHDPIIWSISGAPETEPDGDSQGLPNYGVLVRQYGEALLRISQLESQVNQLAKRLEPSDRPEGSAAAINLLQETQGLRQLADWIDSLQQLFVDTPWTTPDSAEEHTGRSISPDDSGIRLIQEDELRQLRVQVATMARQMARSEQSGETKRAGRLIRGRDHRKAVWKRLARRLGLRISH